jgi:hypothetical protein
MHPRRGHSRLSVTPLTERIGYTSGYGNVGDDWRRSSDVELNVSDPRDDVQVTPEAGHVGAQ